MAVKNTSMMLALTNLFVKIDEIKFYGKFYPENRLTKTQKRFNIYLVRNG